MTKISIPEYEPEEVESSTIAEDAEDINSESNVPPSEDEKFTEAESSQDQSQDPDQNPTEPTPDGTLKLSGEDPPEPGSIYIISEADTSGVITNQSGRIDLTSFGGVPENSQKWVCCRSGGWLGFTNDAGDSTVYLGHDSRGILICTATWHLPWEHFCVRKRAAGGFEIMVRHWFGLQPLGRRYDGTLLGKREIADTWWSFTKVA
ncbi:hypothetical protein Dda_7680 [Drechslerella dactyloides]|uniref:Uncharacterized protein n=1 Tax=Drechslerella dactyloides TaxID=74499 RepID=A0AAD6NGX1_DREDA|nr:hypothetical protein Dda_7680 [Drechslerella dactyloides]